MTFLVDSINPIAVQKMKLSLKDVFSKCGQIRSFLRIWSQLLKKSVMENFIFCAVFVVSIAILGSWEREYLWKTINSIIVIYAYWSTLKVRAKNKLWNLYPNISGKN